MHIPTQREAAILSAVALMALADRLESEGETSISVPELRQQAEDEIIFVNRMDRGEL